MTNGLQKFYKKYYANCLYATMIVGLVVAWALIITAGLTIKATAQPEPKIKLERLDLDIRCLDNHVYYYKLGIGGFSFLAPKLDAVGHPIPCDYK